MKKLLSLMLLSLVLVINVAFADKNMPSKTIKDVIVNVDTGIHFRINESMDNSEECDSDSWFKIKSDVKYEKEMLSLLLSYQAQSKPITFFISGCTGNYPAVQFIY